MKQPLIILLLLGFFSSGGYASEHETRNYVGVFYGVVDSGDGDVENGNLGIVIGGNLESGPGIEFFYSETIDKDEFNSSTLPDLKYSTQVWGLLGSYRIGGDFYGMLKVGYTFVELKADIAGGGSDKIDENGLTYGVAAGMQVGDNGAVELNYLVLPEFEESLNGDNVDYDNELISLGYNWYF